MLRKSIAPLAGALILLAASMQAETLKTWDYSDRSKISFHVEKGCSASFKASQQAKTPDGHPAAEISIDKLRSGGLPWDVQLSFAYDAGLQAGSDYEISFFCKGSAGEALQLNIAQAMKPWQALPNAAFSFEVENEWRLAKFVFKAGKDWKEQLHIPRLLLAGCGEQSTLSIGPVTLSELPKAMPYALNSEWTLFLNVKPPEKFDSIPAEMPGPAGAVKAQRISLQGHSLDLGKLAGRFKETSCAVLYNEFDSPAEGRMRIGLSADWWMAVHFNGRKLFDNFPAGNGSHAFTPDDHAVEMPVKAGRNILAVKVLSGNGGWRFVCGATSKAPEATDNLAEMNGLCIVSEGPGWKPLAMDKFIVKPGTPLDFSELAGERRPAGSFGRLIANRQGHLAFEGQPEKPVRLLGSNSGIGLNERWTKPAMEKYARSLALQGFNTQRLQYIEHILIGASKTKSRDFPAAFKQDVEFDTEGLDAFDYFLHCLKKNGIYWNLDLMGTRSGYCKLQAWAPLESMQPTSGFKMQLLVNPAYRQHWEKAVEMLLNHQNPYTGLKLKDDPALICIEPFNEQDMRLSNKAFMKELTPAFKSFLKEKYKSDEALRKAWGRPEASIESAPDIDEPLLRKGDVAAGDATEFLIKSMSEANEWYYGVIRRCGYRGLVTQWDMIMRTLEMPARAMLPAIAQHSYFAHPGETPTKNIVKKSDYNVYSLGGKASDTICTQNSSINSSYFRAAAIIRFLDRPFLLTEYSHCYPNRYRHERGLYMGAYAALQGWDALYQHGRPAIEPPDEMPHLKWIPPISFERAYDPISRASDAITALAWLRGDVKESSRRVQLTLENKELFPKNTLAAIGDDYAKMAMLVKTGVAYPEVKPLEAAAEVKPDLVIKPSEFSKLDVDTWYASADNKDGDAFPNLLGKLKGAGLLPPSNRSDYSKRIFESETGEILLNGRSETMTVATPRLEGAIMKRNKLAKAGRLTIEACSRPASVAIASLDGDMDLGRANRLLLIFSTNALSSGMIFEDPSMGMMLEVGHLPVLMETGKLSVTLKRDLPGGAPKTYSLYLDGTRAEPVPCEMKDGLLKIELDSSSLKHATPFFEISFP